MKRPFPLLTVFFACLVFSISCPLWAQNRVTIKSAPDRENSRPFSMGFTPWPYEAEPAAVEDTYQKINQYGDIIAHHLGGGIPWGEALRGEPYSPALLAEIEGRISRTEKPVYLAIESLNTGRNGLALYWGESENQPLEAPWSQRSWNHPDVIEAYIRFASDLIECFHPKYFNYGVEVSELIQNNPSGFQDFKVFAEAVYTRLKNRYPDLQLLVSVSLHGPCSEQSEAFRRQISELVPFVDILGISVYGYAFFDHAERGKPDHLPKNWFSQILSVSEGKPLAITETGWVAEPLEVPAFGLSVQAGPEDQQAYVEQLMQVGRQFQLAFVIWFSIVDYDKLWMGPMNSDPLAAIWRDTGLFDEHLEPRPALATWSSWLEKPKHLFYIPHLATAWRNLLFVDGPLGETVEFTLEWLDENGNLGGSREFSVASFKKFDLSEAFPRAHAARITTGADAVRFRLVFIEPVEKGMAEFALTETTAACLQFNYPLLVDSEATLTWKGLALFNAGRSAENVRFTALNQSGRVIAETNLSLKPGQRIRATLDALFALDQQQALTVVRVTAKTTNGALVGLNISGEQLSRLLFTPATQIGVDL